MYTRQLPVSCDYDLGPDIDKHHAHNVRLVPLWGEDRNHKVNLVRDVDLPRGLVQHKHLSISSYVTES